MLQATAYKVHRKFIRTFSMMAFGAEKNRVARIMRQAGIRSRTKKKFKATTNSRHNFPIAPNLLNQDFTVDAPDRVWDGDITLHPDR